MLAASVFVRGPLYTVYMLPPCGRLYVCTFTRSIKFYYQVCFHKQGVYWHVDLFLVFLLDFTLQNPPSTALCCRV